MTASFVPSPNDGFDLDQHRKALPAFLDRLRDNAGLLAGTVMFAILPRANRLVCPFASATSTALSLPVRVKSFSLGAESRFFFASIWAHPTPR